MKKNKKEKIRLIAILFISLLVIATGAMFAIGAYYNGDIGGMVLGIIVALIILIFAYFVFTRGNRDLKNGFPLQDERSIRVLEKASSKAFYISLYLLLLVGFLSDDLIKFRDVSQATSISIGLMALIFAGCWFYYNRKEM